MLPIPEDDWEKQPVVERLWLNGAPGALGNLPEDKPFLHLYLSNGIGRPGSGILVCPGGGYGSLATGHEGRDIARWLNDRGIAAFVLHYRIAPRYHHPAPLQDAQRAMRLIRSHARAWEIDPHKIGIWGFSAGGHLAASVGVRRNECDPEPEDRLEGQSCRPDFMILSYPVITFSESFMHRGSRDNLLGFDPDPHLAEQLSHEKQVTRDTPPTFLFHTSNDPGVPSENSVWFYLALKKAGVPVEMHLYERGPHGVGLAAGDPILSTWTERLEDWLRLHGWRS